MQKSIQDCNSKYTEDGADLGSPLPPSKKYTVCWFGVVHLVYN